MLSSIQQSDRLRIDRRDRCVLPFHAKRDGHLVQDTRFSILLQGVRDSLQTTALHAGTYSRGEEQIEVQEIYRSLFEYHQAMESLIVGVRGVARGGNVEMVQWFLRPHLVLESLSRGLRVSPVLSKVFPSR